MWRRRRRRDLLQLPRCISIYQQVGFEPVAESVAIGLCGARSAVHQAVLTPSGEGACRRNDIKTTLV
jgi:hypothetical protein